MVRILPWEYHVFFQNRPNLLRIQGPPVGVASWSESKTYSVAECFVSNNLTDPESTEKKITDTF